MALFMQVRNPLTDQNQISQKEFKKEEDTQAICPSRSEQKKKGVTTGPKRQYKG